MIDKYRARKLDRALRRRLQAPPRRRAHAARALPHILLLLSGACGPQSDPAQTPSPGRSSAAAPAASVPDSDPAPRAALPGDAPSGTDVGTNADHPSHEVGRKAEVPRAARERIERMIQDLEPIPKTVTSDVLDRWFLRHRESVASAMAAGKEVGFAALQAYADYEGEDSNIRRALLSVAAHAAPEDSRGLLEHLMLHYGHRIDDRTAAAVLLAETAPESFLALAEPFLRRRGPKERTMPPEEFLVRGWVKASDLAGRSPVNVLADVVTNLAMEQAARHYAAEALGDYPDDPEARLALETVLIESSGNGYLRRKAAQSLRESLPREDACELFAHVLGHEADSNFQLFLRNMIDDNCLE